MGPLRLKIFEFLQHGSHSEGEARKSYSAACSVSAASEELPRASDAGSGTHEKPPLPPRTASKKPLKASATPSGPSTKSDVSSPPMLKEEVLIVGGRKTGNEVHENVVFLDKDSKDCIMTVIPTHANISNPSVCASKDSLIVCGGYNRSTRQTISKVQKFSTTDRRWVEFPDLPFPVDCHGSALVIDKLYTIGGRYRKNNQTKHRYSSVNVLDLASLSWEECQSLPLAVESPGIAAVEENIYSMGGSNGKEWSRQATKLNAQKGKITQCQSMREGVEASRSIAAVHRQIFVLDELYFEQYDVIEDQWTELQLLREPSFNPAMVLKQNHPRHAWRF